MPIKKPGKRAFAPWNQKTQAFKKGGKKSAVADLLLTPLIDMFVILVVFLIMSFNASGELQISNDIRLPEAQATARLDRAPIIQISANTVTIEGTKIADSDELLKDRDLRIPGLEDKLGEMRKVDEMMHPGQDFRGEVI